MAPAVRRVLPERPVRPEELQLAGRRAPVRNAAILDTTGGAEHLKGAAGRLNGAAGLPPEHSHLSGY